MTPLMMLALTLPPSLAFVIERWMAGREAQARKLRVQDESVLENQGQALTKLQDRQDAQGAELKRLAEQISILSDRIYKS
jgi:hypothetical protein